ncbi:4Fe-4S single cluster domain-containing protein, partial [Treponema porcinum]
MYYGNIKKTDIADGDGVRVSLFVSGCRNCCKGCFQPETWDFKYGTEFTQETEKQIIELLKPSYISGLTVLGGEPFEEENQRVLA